jgi:hypothetical protein
MLWSFLDLMFSILGNFLFIFSLEFFIHLCNLKKQLVSFIVLYLANPNLIFFHLSSKEVINYDNVRVTYNQLATLQTTKSSVDIYVVNAFCRKLFKDKHPKDSGRHYFFSTFGVSLTFFLLFYVAEKLPNHLFWIFVSLTFFEPHFVCCLWKDYLMDLPAKAKDKLSPHDNCSSCLKLANRSHKFTSSEFVSIYNYISFSHIFSL